MSADGERDRRDSHGWQLVRIVSVLPSQSRPLSAALRLLMSSIGRGPRHRPELWQPVLTTLAATATYTFLFTDVEGSTTLLSRLGSDVYATLLSQHNELVRAALARNAGTEVDTQGDAFFAVFTSAQAALAAVVEIRRDFAAASWPNGEHPRLRMGLHCGEALAAGTGYIGLDVHKASRIAAIGHGGQALLSESAVSLVRDSLPDGASLQDLGPHRLKDLGRPERIYQLNVAGEPSDFPPVRSLDNPALANNLPAQPSPFIGRERELRAVRELIEASHMVTLAGAGGIGKTRLALQAAAGLLDGSGDGVWLVELAALTDPAQLASAVAAALDIRLAGEDATEGLIAALTPQRILIILDNCEHLLDACAQLAGLILRRCPKVHLLATSREPLGIAGESIYRVPSLSLPSDEDSAEGLQASDAIVLFLHRASAQGRSIDLDDRNCELITSLCRRLDGMPLAIELATARLSSLSVQELHDRLGQRFRLLTSGDRAAMPRQQTLRATVDWSYSLLTDAEKRTLHRLSVFSEGFDLKAVESVCGFGDLDPLDIVDFVSSLVDKSLVIAETEVGATRYRLLETIRQFAAERLVDDEREALAVADAHCSYFLALAEQTGLHLESRNQRERLRLLDRDSANLQRGLAHAVGDASRTSVALRFGVAMRDYLRCRSAGETAPFRSLLATAARRPEARATPDLLVGTLNALGESATKFDDTFTPGDSEQAVALARTVDDPRLLVDALSTHAAALYFTGEAGRGQQYGAEAVKRARLLADDRLHARALMLYSLCADDDAEPALVAQALPYAERSGDQKLLATLHNNAGDYALRDGRTEEARRHLEASIACEHAGGIASVAAPHVNLGWALRAEGRDSDAQAEFAIVMRASRRDGNDIEMAMAALGLGCLAGDRGEWERAAQLHGASEACIRRSRGNVWEPLEDGYRSASVERVRAALGEATFERVFKAGTALSVDEIVALALAEAQPAR